jgi:NAD(P)-dependent dehydrogenase (short-subunit alcohol dehydrogenase family)
VLVTGGTGDIGKATATGLAALGARVGITGRDQGLAAAAAADIRAATGNEPGEDGGQFCRLFRVRCAALAWRLMAGAAPQSWHGRRSCAWATIFRTSCGDAGRVRGAHRAASVTHHR